MISTGPFAASPGDIVDRAEGTGQLRSSRSLSAERVEGISRLTTIRSWPSRLTWQRASQRHVAAVRRTVTNDKRWVSNFKFLIS